MVEPFEPHTIHFSRVMAKSPSRCLLMSSDEKVDPVADNDEGRETFAHVHSQRALSLLKATKMTAANLNNKLSRQGPVNSQNLGSSPYDMRERQQPKDEGTLPSTTIALSTGCPSGVARAELPDAEKRAALFKELNGIGRVAMQSMATAQLTELCNNRNLAFAADADDDVLISLLTAWKKSKPSVLVRHESSDEDPEPEPKEGQPTKDGRPKKKTPPSKKELKEEQEEIALKKREDAEYEEGLRERERAQDSARKRRAHTERMQRIQEDINQAEGPDLPPLLGRRKPIREVPTLPSSSFKPGRLDAVHGRVDGRVDGRADSQEASEEQQSKFQKMGEQLSTQGKKQPLH